MTDVPAVAGAYPMTPAMCHRRMMRSETMISMAVNAFIPAAIIWAIGLKPPATAADQATMLGRATVLATFFMSLIITALVRGRLARGGEPMARLPGLAWIPRPLPLRAIFWAVCALATVLPLGMLAAQAAGLAQMDRTGFFAFNLLFGALLGLMLTPFVVWIALTDTRQERRP